jgi:hypothetical protein
MSVPFIGRDDLIANEKGARPQDLTGFARLSDASDAQYLIVQLSAL